MENKVKIAWNYGGGRQTAAIAVLIANGALPRPDYVQMSDTSREKSATWRYYENHLGPYLKDKCGITVDIVPHEEASSDLYNGEGTLLIPAFDKHEGKMTNYCSGYWKREPCTRHIRKRIDADGCTQANLWLGYSTDEAHRFPKTQRLQWLTVAAPLIDLGININTCIVLVEKAGLPPAPKSTCYICPNQSDRQWIELADEEPSEFEKACEVDELIRLNDERDGLFLHQRRMPLRMAVEESRKYTTKDEHPLFASRACQEGGCWT